MKRVVFTGPRSVDVQDVPVPSPGRGQALVEVRACGLCTLEQRVYRGTRSRYPFAGGHEVSGVVVESVDGEVTPGTLVAVSRLPRCDSCINCVAGKDNLCAYSSGVMADLDGPGGLAEFVVVSNEDTAPVDGSALDAALVEPLACVLNSLDSAGVVPGVDVAIIGNGFMGVLHARAAAAVGARAILVETHPTPAGLDGAWDGAMVAQTAALDVLGSEKVDVVIVIREPTAGLALAGELARPGGVVSVFASVAPETVLGLSAKTLRNKELSLTATASHRRRDFNCAAFLVSSGSITVTDLIHRKYPLADVLEALEYSVCRDTARVVVQPGDLGA